MYGVVFYLQDGAGNITTDTLPVGVDNTGLNLEAQIREGTINKLLQTDAYLTLVLNNNQGFTPSIILQPDSGPCQQIKDITVSMHLISNWSIDSISYTFDTALVGDTLSKTIHVSDLNLPTGQGIYRLQITARDTVGNLTTMDTLVVPGLEEFDGKVTHIIIDTVGPNFFPHNSEKERILDSTVSEVTLTLDLDYYELYTGASFDYEVHYKEGNSDEPINKIAEGTITNPMDTTGTNSLRRTIQFDIKYHSVQYNPYTLYFVLTDRSGNSTTYSILATHQI
jgi:hypothetical protein